MNCDVCVAYVAISLRYGSRGPPRVPWSMWRIDQSINLEWRYSVSGDMHTILTMILTLEWSVHVPDFVQGGKDKTNFSRKGMHSRK